MTIAAVAGDHGVTVRLSGEHDISTDLVVASMLAHVIAVTEGDVVVDLSEVQFFGASTIGVLVTARRILNGRSRDLTLCAPSRCARRVIDICGVSSMVQPGPSSGARPLMSVAANR
jgi:anti-anti-sigma factor